MELRVISFIGVDVHPDGDIEAALRLNEEPTSFVAAMIEDWEYPKPKRHSLRVTGRDLVIRARSADDIVAAVEWLMRDNPLLEMVDRVRQREAEAKQLVNTLENLVAMYKPASPEV